MKKCISIFTALTTILWLSGVAMLPIAHATTFADGDLAREADEFDVYIVKLVGDKMFKRLILNPDVFNMYGHLKWTDIQVVDDGTLTAYTVSELVRADGDEKVYKLYPDGDVGTKKWVESVDCFTDSGFDSDSIYVINTFDRESYITAITNYCEAVVEDEEEDEEVVGTEGLLEAKLLAVPNNTDVYEDDSNKAVMAIEVESEDSDITIKRIDVRFLGDKPWENISYVSLYDEDNAVKGLDVSSSIFIKDATNDYRLRLSGLDILVAKDTKETLTLKVDGLSNADLEMITLSIPANGIRYEDSIGLSSVVATVTGDRTFTSAVAETGNIEVKVDEDGVEEGIIVVDDEDITEDQYLLIFEVEALDVDLELTDITVMLDTTTADVEDVVYSVSLYDGADEIGIETPSDNDLTTQDFTFEDLEVLIDEDGVKRLSIKVDILEQGEEEANYANAVTITATITAIEGEDANDEDIEGDISGDLAIGEAQYLYLAAPEAAFTSAVITANPEESGDIISADGTIKFTVKALGDDVTLAYQSFAFGTGTAGAAGWSTERANTGDYSAYLVFRDAHTYVDFVPAPGITLASLSADPDYGFSYYLETESDYGPQFELKFENAGATAYVEVTFMPQTGNSVTGAWTELNLNSTFGAIGSWDGATFALYDDLDDVQVTLTDESTWELTRVRVELYDDSGSAPDRECYIDDITIGGVTYEPSIIMSAFDETNIKVAISTRYIGIDGDEFTEDVIITKGDTVDVIVEGRIQAIDATTGYTYRSYLKVDKVDVLPSSLLDDLRTGSVVISDAS